MKIYCLVKELSDRGRLIKVISQEEPTAFSEFFDSPERAIKRLSLDICDKTLPDLIVIDLPAQDNSNREFIQFLNQSKDLNAIPTAIFTNTIELENTSESLVKKRLFLFKPPRSAEYAFQVRKLLAFYRIVIA